MSAPEPSPEVKAMIRNFVAIQREKYGDDWKAKLSAKMAAETAPLIEGLLSLRKDTPK